MKTGDREGTEALVSAEYKANYQKSWQVLKRTL